MAVAELPVSITLDTAPPYLLEPTISGQSIENGAAGGRRRRRHGAQHGDGVSEIPVVFHAVEVIAQEPEGIMSWPLTCRRKWCQPRTVRIA